MKLPTQKTKIKSNNPKNLIIFGLPKVGKTTLLSLLPKCLIIDYQIVAKYSNVFMKTLLIAGKS